jgi:hypothetical protein
VAVVLLVAGALLSRAAGDGVAGAAAGGMALPYAAAAGLLFAAPNQATLGLGADQLLVGASALALASVVGAVGVGHGLRVFAGGITVAGFTIVGSGLGFTVKATGAAAILVVVLVAGIGLAPLLAVRLGKLPLPIVTASADVHRE